MTARPRGRDRARSRPQADRTAAVPSRRGWSTRLVVALLAVAVIASAASAVLYERARRTATPAGAIPPVRDNILLVTIDTARADHFGAYGYARARTRHIDQLASEGVRFDGAISTAPITLPAHASIFTGLYPFEHGVRNNGNFYLSDKFDTLATTLAGQGYQTAAFVSAFVLDRRYGLARGFQTYDDRMQGARAQVVSLEAERRGDRTGEALSAWLGAHAAPGRPPFFAWLHLYDPHEPYRAPQPFGGAFADSPYDGEIAFTDAVVASILDRLAQLGVRDRTIVAIVGDHGESLGEHGEETHSMFVYEATLRVPLILWRPGRIPAGGVVKTPVRIIDVAPTLLDLVGAPRLHASHARTLVPLVIGQPAAEAPPAYAETYLPEFYLNWSPLRALRDERWKFIEAPKPELYDLTRDPGERNNLYAAQPQTAEAMRSALVRLTGGSAGAMNPVQLDREAIEKLTALGYVAPGGGQATAAPDAARRDPKDVIAIFNRLRRANSAVRDRRFADALPILRAVLDEDPRNAFAQLVLGSAYMGMGQYRDAIAQYEKYLALVPTSSYAHQWMAICYVRLGEPDNAMKEASAALALDPRYADARILRGGILASRGRYDEALADLRGAVTSDPVKPMVRLDLAKVLDESGRRDEARKEYQTILVQQPDYMPALTGLGALEAKAGRPKEAEDLLRRALAIDPTHDTTRFDLARVLEQEGTRGQAIAEYRALADGRDTLPRVREAARERLNALSR